ncbi:hypothetical protein OG592_26975 [Streptomyces avidinii]|uniref:hypothetical protein n=1 Tax=Streptomyces avidinii TaxID=1895 RepID=UPI003866D974|nr:hypothetical protein OG592_26975 [Streptomyces avidinii]
MAKESGLGWTTLSVDDSAGSPQAIKNDITNLAISTPRAVQDVTGIDKSAMERLLLLADASFTLNGVFNDAAGASHAVFKTVPSTSVARTTTAAISGQTLAPELLYTDYQLTRADDGALTWSAPGVLADGVVPAWS